MLIILPSLAEVNINHEGCFCDPMIATFMQCFKADISTDCFHALHFDSFDSLHLVLVLLIFF